MRALLAAVVAGAGVHLLWTSLVLGRTGFGAGPGATRSKAHGSAMHDWLVQAGLEEVDPQQFVAVTSVIGDAWRDPQ